VQSAHDVADTADRLEHALNAKGMKIFARINHAAGGVAAGTELPQKALIWQDGTGTTWLSYNDPKYLEKRHQITGCEPVLGKLSQAPGNFAAAATAK
jgi:uncharacterized protein (DUF302 family)